MAQLLVYLDLVEPELRSMWAQRIGLPITNFIRSTTIEGRHPTMRLNTGICIVYVNSTYLKTKILKWLELLPEQLMNRKYYENI